MPLVALIFLLFSSLSDAVIYKRTGDKVVIPTGSAADGITFITWNHNEDIAVEWYGGEPSAYRQFKGCTTLDTRTGALTISNLTQEHSGSYTAEINNNRVADTTEIQVISPVPKPTVSKLCDAEMTYCTLTCEGDITDAGPVDYSWSVVDPHYHYEGQQVNLTKNDHDRWFQCVMKNPISSETSEEFLNPFLAVDWMGSIIIIIIILFVVMTLILIGLLVGIYRYRKYKSMKEHRRRLAVFRNRVENSQLLAVVRNGVQSSNQTPQTSSVFLDINRETAVMNACETSNLGKTSEKPNNEPEISSKKEEEIKFQVHSSETSESNNQTEESADESNEEETTRPQLEEPNQSISVSV